MSNIDLPPPFVSEGITKIVLGENVKGGLFTAEQLRAAVEAEREACAKLAVVWPGYFASFRAADQFAELIRARGKS